MPGHYSGDFVPSSNHKNKKPHRRSLPEGLDKVEISELMEVNESLKNFDIEVVPAEQQHKDHSYKWQKDKKNEKRTEDISTPITFLRGNLL